MIKNKEQRYKAEKEIEFWARHWDLDKFNYGKSVSTFISSMALLITVFIGVIAIIVSYTGLEVSINFRGEVISVNLKPTFILFFLVMVLIIFSKFKKKYLGQIRDHRVNFMVRDEHLRRMYKDLADVDKDKLNKRFGKIKKSVLDRKLKLPY